MPLPPVKSEVVESNDNRYNPSDLGKFLIELKPEEQDLPFKEKSFSVVDGQSNNAPNKKPDLKLISRTITPEEIKATINPLIFDPNASPDPDNFMILMEIFNPTFYASWENDRPDFLRGPKPDDSPSKFDASLFSFAAKCNWTDQEMLNLSIAFRRKHGHKLKFHNRPYYGRSIIKAKRDAQRDKLEKESTLKKKSPETPDPAAADAKNGSGTASGNISDQSGQIELPEPQPLTEPPPPAPVFPIDCLPKVAADYIKNAAYRMQCPIDLVAIPVLVTMAGAIGSKIEFQPKQLDNWPLRACLWGMIISPKGTRKSSALKAATKPLEKIQAKLAETDKIELDKWKAKNDEHKVRVKNFNDERKAILKKNGSNAKLPLPPAVIQNHPERPIENHIIINDITIEKLGDIMQQSPGITLIEDEFAGFMLNMNRYNPDGSNRQFWLQCHSGGPKKMQRVSREGVLIPDVYCNLIGGIQPSVAEEIFMPAKKTEKRKDDGFLERFGLMVYPEKMKRKYTDGEEDPVLTATMCQMYDTLFFSNWNHLLYPPAQQGDKPFCKFDKKAQAAFKKWMIKHIDFCDNIEEGDPLEGMHQKAEGLLASLILVIHLGKIASNESQNSPKDVDLDSFLKGIRLIEKYFLPMWRRIFACFGTKNDDLGIKKLGNWIKKEKILEFSLRDIKRKCWAIFKTEEDIEDAISVLFSKNWILDKRNITKGRKPSWVYVVNELVHK